MGFTANTIQSQEDARESTSFEIRMPHSLLNASVLPLSGSQAEIRSGCIYPLRQMPPMMAAAILPPPINPREEIVAILSPIVVRIPKERTR